MLSLGGYKNLTLRTIAVRLHEEEMLEFEKMDLITKLLMRHDIVIYLVSANEI